MDVLILIRNKSYKKSVRWKIKTKEEITKELEQAIEDYNKEFSDVLIPKEKFGMACALKGYIDGLKWVLEDSEVQK